ncbi:hypothetical protein CC78DRAFT_587136 [Lojkania enalia]|uniref:Uncharacterized protein n=1 Tax=Lojkania enalia TaxID=147567 RepID=A0A9P4N171_9PLEO|nr:hypothetical protein CC78DRAFT_587136 [Didymosphaeria enalia]
MSLGAPCSSRRTARGDPSAGSLVDAHRQAGWLGEETGDRHGKLQQVATTEQDRTGAPAERRRHNSGRYYFCRLVRHERGSTWTCFLRSRSSTEQKRPPPDPNPLSRERCWRRRAIGQRLPQLWLAAEPWMTTLRAGTLDPPQAPCPHAMPRMPSSHVLSLPVVRLPPHSGGKAALSLASAPSPGVYIPHTYVYRALLSATAGCSSSSSSCTPSPPSNDADHVT